MNFLYLLFKEELVQRIDFRYNFLGFMIYLIMTINIKLKDHLIKIIRLIYLVMTINM